MEESIPAMTSPLHPLEEDYARKAASYYSNPRSEMMRFLPENAKLFLEVGCGRGEFGAQIKKTRKAEIWGVEMHSPSAESAKGVLDQVLCAPFAPGLELPNGYFDCIVLNDVLEHLLDPGEALRYAAVLLNPGGSIVASIPNFRYFPVLYQVVVQGKWEYEDHGVLDRTHLRFFTQSSIETLFHTCGFHVERIEGIRPAVSRKWSLLNALLMHRIEDTKFPQFAVVARKNPA